MGTVGVSGSNPEIAISIIIPCCNEEAGVPLLRETIPPVLVNLAEYGAVEIVMVDDGSTDGTWSALNGLAAEIPAIRLARHPMNYGLGAALRTGIARSRGAVIVTTDADGTYPLAEIPRLLMRLTDDTDIVTASPYHPAGGVNGVPAWRLAFSRGASWCYRIVLAPEGRRVHTYTSIFRAYRREIVPYIIPDHEGFLAVAEMLVRGMLARCTVAEYPTTLGVRRFGQSKGRVLQITLSHLRLLTRLALGRIQVAQRPAFFSTRSAGHAQEAIGD